MQGGARSTGGRVPSPDALNRGRKDDQAKFTSFVDTGAVHGPDLPKFTVVFPASGSCGTRWNGMTLAWFAAMRRSPFAQSFHELDWLFLIDTAMIHHLWMITRRDMYFKEFRQRVSLFGCTPADRQRLRWVVEQSAGTDESDSSDNDELTRQRMKRLIEGA